MQSRRIHHLLNTFELFSFTLCSHKRIYLNFDIFPYTVNSFRGPTRPRTPWSDPFSKSWTRGRPRTTKKRSKTKKCPDTRSIDLRVLRYASRSCFAALLSILNALTTALYNSEDRFTFTSCSSDAQRGREPLPPHGPQSLFFRQPQRPVFAVPPTEHHGVVAAAIVTSPVVHRLWANKYLFVCVCQCSWNAIMMKLNGISEKNAGNHAARLHVHYKQDDMGEFFCNSQKFIVFFFIEQSFYW